MKTPLLLIYCISLSYAQNDCSNTGKRKFFDNYDSWRYNLNDSKRNFR